MSDDKATELARQIVTDWVDTLGSDDFDWAVERIAALLRPHLLSEGSQKEGSCGTAQTADTATLADTLPTVNDAVGSKELLSRPHETATVKSVSDLENVLNRPEPHVEVLRDGSCRSLSATDVSAGEREDGIAWLTSGFHWRDGWYFKRQHDGSVRVACVVGDTVYRDLCIPPNEWASIVSGVSKNGEDSESYKEALDFHQQARAARDRGRERVKCHHEPYQGRCVHCDVAFHNGLPDPPKEGEK